MSLLCHVSHYLRDVGRDIQFRLEGAMLHFSDFSRPAYAHEKMSDDDVADPASAMARFERMLRVLEEKSAWPNESLRLEDDEEFDIWSGWPISLCRGAMAAAPAV
jgi:hypothetical protein